MGHQRDLVRPGGVPCHDPAGLLRTQDPQDHGCHDPRGRWPPLRQALQQLHGGAQRSVAVLPDVFPDRRFRRGHQRSDPVDPPERLPAAGRLCHHLLYHLRRHDRGPGLRPHPVRHHSRRPGDRHPDRPEVRGRLAGHLRSSARRKAEHDPDWLGLHHRLFLQLLLHLPLRPRDGLPFRDLQGREDRCARFLPLRHPDGCHVYFPDAPRPCRLRAEGSAARPC